MALPDFNQLFLEMPLYEKFDISAANGEYVFQLLYFSGKVDSYCPLCDKQSTFKGIQTLPTPGGFRVNSFEMYYIRANNIYETWTNRIHQINLVCTRVESHLMQISVYLTQDKLFKVGQYPSIADISMPDLRKYREVLSKDKYKELNRGVGLITHGIGVGAFVYLRRIFEDLIEDAHKKESTTKGWDDEIFHRSRMDEKIELLKSSLPSFLVESRKLYSILSKGIHELTEDECLEYFSTVKLGVELILDEKLEEKRRKEKIELARKSISKIHNDLAKE